MSICIKKYLFAKFLSLLRHAIIFWGGESDNIKVFSMQKGVLQIIRGADK